MGKPVRHEIKNGFKLWHRLDQQKQLFLEIYF